MSFDDIGSGWVGGILAITSTTCITPTLSTGAVEILKSMLTRLGRLVSLIFRAIEAEIRESSPFFTSAFNTFRSGAENFLASSRSLQEDEEEFQAEPKIILELTSGRLLFSRHLGLFLR